MQDQARPSLIARASRIWPAFGVGLGLLATMAWIALLGWLLFRGILWLY